MNWPGLHVSNTTRVINGFVHVPAYFGEVCLRIMFWPNVRGWGGVIYWLTSVCLIQSNMWGGRVGKVCEAFVIL